MTDGELARERAQVVLGEDLADQSQLAARDDVAITVGGGDPRRLLAAVLQREERVEGETRSVVTGRVETERRHIPRVGCHRQARWMCCAAGRSLGAASR